MADPDDDQDEVDPVEFVRAMMSVSPEDAEKVRERTPGTRLEKPRQEGPSAEHGDG